MREEFCYNNNNNNNNNNTMIHLVMCFTTAKQSQLQPSAKTTKTTK
jgi:hypothetical protein